MKNTLLLLSVPVLMASCNHSQESMARVEVADTVINSCHLLESTSSAYDNFRDINNFDVELGFPYFDSLNKLYAKDPAIETVVKNDLCAGDHCGSFRSLTSKTTNTMIYLSKGDNGEYGFSNDQFILRNDSLQVVRNFHVGIKEYPTKSIETLWSIEESIFYFYSTHVKIVRREALVRAPLHEIDFSLKSSPVHLETGYNTRLYQEKTAELESLLASKDYSDE